MSMAPDMSMARLLGARADATPDHVYAEFIDGRRKTVAELAGEAWTLAGALRGLGVAPGDHVASWQPNGEAAVRDFFGILCARAIHTPLNTAYRGRILEHAVNLSGAAVLLAHPELVPRLADLRLPSLRVVVTSGEAALRAPVQGLSVIDAGELLASARPVPDGARVGGWETMAMVFTSGTTGPSKGVLQSYFYYRRLSQDFLGELRGSDRYYHCLPPFHQGALVAMYTMLRDGGSIFVRDGFRVGAFWEEARRSGSTSALLIGGMANLLMKQPQRPDDADNPMRTVKIVPLIPDFREFGARFGVEVTTCYGMTEIGTPFVSLDPDNGATCGKLSAGFQVRLADEHDLEVQGTGELLVRHDDPWTLNSGYKDMPEATAAGWRNGWFHTGDAFRRDADGNYYYVDRIKDAIRRRGENISSMELEREVVAHPAVLEAAALGVPSQHADDEVLVIVVPRPGMAIDMVDLTTFLSARLPHYMVPRYVRVVAELPKTPTNKVRKAELRAEPMGTDVWDREAAGILIRRDALAPSEG